MSTDSRPQLTKDLVALRFGIDRRKLIRGGTFKMYALPRHVLSWCLRAQGRSYPDVGAEMGGRHHTTVMHSCEVVDKDPRLLEVAVDLALRVELEEVVMNWMTKHHAGKEG
jgi:chromosomal replication initiation ATPase DnaA